VTQPTITFRASAVLLARLEQLAEARGCARSAAIEAAIVEATVPKDAPAVPTEAEILELLGLAARGGSVPAMRELWRHHQDQRQAGVGTLAGVDELAALRESR
jgi:predicted transcriptional regulator